MGAVRTERTCRFSHSAFSEERLALRCLPAGRTTVGKEALHSLRKSGGGSYFYYFEFQATWLKPVLWPPAPSSQISPDPRRTQSGVFRRLGLGGVSAQGALGLQAPRQPPAPGPVVCAAGAPSTAQQGASLAPAGWGLGALPTVVSEHWGRGAFPPSPWWAGQGHRGSREAQRSLGSEGGSPCGAAASRPHSLEMHTLNGSPGRDARGLGRSACVCTPSPS